MGDVSLARCLAAAVAALGACGPAPERHDRAPEAPPEERELRVEALDAEWERIAREAARDWPLPRQQEAAESEHHYRLALGYFEAGDFERARAEAARAVELRPDNLAARKLLGEILDLLGRRPGGFGGPGAADQEKRHARVRAEQAQTEIAQHLITGERLFQAGLHEEALAEFESAERKILSLPYEIKAMNDLLPRVRAWIARSRSEGRRP